MTDDEITKLSLEFTGLEPLSDFDYVAFARSVERKTIAAEREAAAAWLEHLEGWQIDELDLPAEIREGSHITNKHVAIEQSILPDPRQPEHPLLPARE